MSEAQIDKKIKKLKMRNVYFENNKYPEQEFKKLLTNIVNMYRAQLKKKCMCVD